MRLGSPESLVPLDLLSISSLLQQVSESLLPLDESPDLVSEVLFK